VSRLSNTNEIAVLSASIAPAQPSTLGESRGFGSFWSNRWPNADEQGGRQRGERDADGILCWSKTHAFDFGRQARAYVHSLPYRRCGFSADNPDALGERPNVVVFLMGVVGALRSALRSRVSLVAENLALRQQLAVLRRQTKRNRLMPLAKDGLPFALRRLRLAETDATLSSHDCPRMCLV
jgi:hypothetical protein